MRHGPRCSHGSWRGARQARCSLVLDDDIDSEHWFVSTITGVGPVDCHGEFHSPPTGVAVICQHPADPIVPNDPVWNVFRQKLEQIYPSPISCTCCQQRWHHLLEVNCNAPIEIHTFTANLHLGEAEPLARKFKNPVVMSALFEAAVEEELRQLQAVLQAAAV